MDVGAWLRGLGLEEYAEAFAENGVDAALLPEISNEDLKDLGIVRLADRKRLLKAISGLVAGDGQSDTEPIQLTVAAGERRQVTVLFAATMKPTSCESITPSGTRSRASR